ncbi:MAG: nuclear transport factor 2 family protein [Saprospiraceae bacterium]
MSHFKEKIAKYRALMEKGAFLQIIDEFYHEDIRQIENNEPAIEGKLSLREMEEKTLEGVHSVELEISSLVADEDQQMVMGEMLIHFHSKKHGWKRLREAFVQQWKEDKIIYQRFYYKEIENL